MRKGDMNFVLGYLICTLIATTFGYVSVAHKIEPMAFETHDEYRRTVLLTIGMCAVIWPYLLVRDVVELVSVRFFK
jgi:hypothetical protein